MSSQNTQPQSRKCIYIKKKLILTSEQCMVTKAQRYLNELNKINLKKTFKPVPISTFGEYFVGQDGNTAIAMKFVGHTSLAILESGASVVIDTKEMWE